MSFLVLFAAKFGLELAPEKAKVLEFVRFAEENRERRENSKPRTRLRRTYGSGQVKKQVVFFAAPYGAKNLHPAAGSFLTDPVF